MTMSLLLLAASCGGTTVEVAPSLCATVTPGPDGSPTPTPTPCPAGATGAPNETTGELAGESWEGTAEVTSLVVYPGPDATCQDGWDLEFTFVASVDGTIDGVGTADLTTPPTCSFPINDVPTVAHVEYQVLGRLLRVASSFDSHSRPRVPERRRDLGGFFSIFSVPASPTGGPPVGITVSGRAEPVRARGSSNRGTRRRRTRRRDDPHRCVTSRQPQSAGGRARPWADPVATSRTR